VLTRLAFEAKHGPPSGSIYAESTCEFLVHHIIYAHSSLASPPRRCSGGLPARRLKPVLEYIAENLAQTLTLYRLAELAGVSPRHFERPRPRSRSAVRKVRRLRARRFSRSLGSVQWFLVATAAYLKKRGRPRSPEGLKKHDCLLFGDGLANAGVHLERGERALHVPLSPRLLVSDLDVLHAAVTAGLGIALLPAFRCVQELRAKQLERVLREWNAPATPVQVVYPSTRHLSPKVKAFVEHLQGRMTPPPWQLGPMP
jgi:hypothetical protein